MKNAEALLQELQQSELKSDDSFQFECSMCGACCRRRSEPIMVTGADIFCVAQAMRTSIEAILPKNFEWYLGEDSHIPIYMLAERLDGSCRFLRNGHCMIQQNKPVVCAIYPLGRFYDFRNNSFHYFVNRGVPCLERGKSKVWTLEEWLAEFHIRETEAMAAAWYRLMDKVTRVTAQMKKEDIQGEFLERLRYLLYLGYDTNAPYIKQVEARIPTALDILNGR